MRMFLAAALALLAARGAEARVNATGAVEVFAIFVCDECIADEDSIFCTEASDDMFVSNSTYKMTIAQKKRMYGPADGTKYCWEGTFGKLLRNQGTFDEILGTATNVTANLDCATSKLFYRQCVISSELSIILIAIGSIVFVSAFTCGLFFCGCCKCCNKPGDESKWGCCNRYCPWMPCADPPKDDSEGPKHLVQPATEEENKSSLFGKNPALKMDSMAGKPRTLAGKAPGGTTVSMANPLTGPAGSRPLSASRSPGAGGAAARRPAGV